MTTTTSATNSAATRTDRILLAVLGVVVLGLVVWCLTLLDGPEPLVFWTPALVHLLIGCIGAFLLLRTEARRLGWLLSLQTLFLLGGFIGPAVYAETGATWASVVEALGSLPLGFQIAAVILYPTGRAESRVLAGLVGVTVVGLLVASTNWLGVALGWWVPIADPLQLAIALTSLPLFASFFEQARIYRRRPPLQQQQVKWYVLGLLAVPMYLVPGLLGWSEESFALVDAATTALFPLAILIGITRYRLYEIDRLVSRTVGYGLVVAVLAGVAVGTLALLTTVLPTEDRFATVAATLAVLALFDPVRRRVLDVVDRRFDRTRYVAQQVVDAFGRTVADQTDVDAVRARLHDVVDTTLAPVTVAVWEPPATHGRGG